MPEYTDVGAHGTTLPTCGPDGLDVDPRAAFWRHGGPMRLGSSTGEAWIRPIVAGWAGYKHR